MRSIAIKPIALAGGGALLLAVLLFSTAHAQVATTTSTNSDTSSASAQNTSPSSATTGTDTGTTGTNSNSTTSGSTSSSVTSTATGAGSTSGGTAAAFVSLSVNSGNPRDTVLVSGAGFIPGENVQVSLGGTTSIVPTATDGSFSAPMTVPQIPDGITSVSAEGLESGRIADTTFSIGPNTLTGAASSTLSVASTTPLSDAEAITILQSEVSSLQQQVSQLTAEVTILQGAAGTGTTP